ncbi:MAG: DsbC family protein [Syntrophobacterales bacterium]|jgi:thiol:disulfide interchange protein DsbC|nr:DsbC family protein [Syntrophobacterales bacterium]
MKKRSPSILFIAIFMFAFAIHGYADPVTEGTAKTKNNQETVTVKESVEEGFKKNFPNIKFDAINPTDIKGIYEVVVGTKIGYFAPETGYLIVGEIRDKSGANLTANRRNEIIASKAKSLPLDKAIKIGSGPSTVIEFTDPDCPFCRKASTFLNQKTDATRYIFFVPLPNHPDAENKARFVFCATDRAKAYEEAMTGKLDDKKYETCKKPEVEGLLKAHKGLANKMGISSTPFFIANGKAIPGADIPKLEEALKQDGK